MLQKLWGCLLVPTAAGKASLTEPVSRTLSGTSKVLDASDFINGNVKADFQLEFDAEQRPITGFEALSVRTDCYRVTSIQATVRVRAVDPHALKGSSVSGIVNALHVEHFAVEAGDPRETEDSGVLAVPIVVHLEGSAAKLRIRKAFESWSKGDHLKNLSSAFSIAVTGDAASEDIHVIDVDDVQETFAPCTGDLSSSGSVTATIGSESSVQNSTDFVPISSSDSKSVEFSFSVCSVPSGSINATVTLERLAEEEIGLLNLSLVAVALDTRPYSVSCLEPHSRRAGHTLTHVGPYVVMFGGKMVMPNGEETMASNDLWIMRVSEDDGSMFWHSLDEKHNIFIKPRARYGHIAAGTYDGLYVISGGHSGKEYMTDIWAIRIMYNSIGDNPKQHETFPPFTWRECESRRGGGAGLFSSGVLVGKRQWLVIGGQRPGGIPTSDIWQIDLAGMTPSKVHQWQLHSYTVTTPSPRFGQSLCVWPARPWHALKRAGLEGSFGDSLNLGGLLLLGGVEIQSGSLPRLKDDLWFFDLETKRWAELEAHPHSNVKRPGPLAFHSAAAVGSALLVIGGVSVRYSSSGLDFSVRSEVWRWMDHEGWALQHEHAGSTQKRMSVGSTAWWPALGRVVLYGGLTNVSSWQQWYDSTLEAEQDEGLGSWSRRSWSATPRYFPPVFQKILAKDVTEEVLVVHEEACEGLERATTPSPFAATPPPNDLAKTLTEKSDAEQQRHDDEGIARGLAWWEGGGAAAAVCLPCSGGTELVYEPSPAANVTQSRNNVTLPHMRPPWIAKDAPQCRPCKSGSIYTDGSCRHCPVGFFGAFAGMVTWKMCWPCHQDEYSDHEGSIACKPCLNKVNANVPNVTNPHTHSRPGDADDDKAKLSSIDLGRTEAKKCPMLSRSDMEELSPQTVSESNRPHGQEAAHDTHLWWQQVTFIGGTSMLLGGVLVLALVHARRPRGINNFLRSMDMRPVTGALVNHTPAGGFLFLIYLVIVSGVGFVGLGRFLLYNGHLSSMSVPAEEEFARVGKISVHINVSATIDGYTGPCVKGDEVFWEGQPSDPPRAWKENISDDASSQRLLSAGAAQYPASEFFLVRGHGGHGVIRRSDRSTSYKERAAHEDGDMFRERDGEFSAVAGNFFHYAHDVQERISGRRLNDMTIGIDRRNVGRCHSGLKLDADHVKLGDVPGADTEHRRFSTCERLSNERCRATFVCKSCSLEGKVPQVRLSVSDSHVFTAAREIRWNVRTDWLQKQEKKIQAFSSVESVLTAGELDRCLRGSMPSRLHVTLVPTDYRDLMHGMHLFGFVVQFIDAKLGSTSSPWDFHQQTSELHSVVEMSVSHSFYKLVLSQSRTSFDFLTQMLGFLSGMSLLARVSNAMYNNIVHQRGHTGIKSVWNNAVITALASVLCFLLSKEKPEDETVDYKPLTPQDGDVGALLSGRSDSNHGSNSDGVQLRSRPEREQKSCRDLEQDISL